MRACVANRVHARAHVRVSLRRGEEERQDRPVPKRLAKGDKCGGTEIGRGHVGVDRSGDGTGQMTGRDVRGGEGKENMESVGGTRHDRANLELFA